MGRNRRCCDWRPAQLYGRRVGLGSGQTDAVIDCSVLERALLAHAAGRGHNSAGGCAEA